ncbi:MAG TPA: AI-2E family transporter [Thermoanaerobaculia bacterium]|nr:AI-2E family transporter [Thermoanaerobaculia bacterium]
MSAETKSRSESALIDAPPSTKSAALRLSAQILLALAAVVGTLWVLHRIQGVLLLLALSILFGYLVAPVVSFFSRPIRAWKGRTLPLPVAIWTAYLVIFGVIAAGGMLLWPVLNHQFGELRAQAPEYVARVQNGWHAWKDGQTRMLPRDFRVAVNGLVDDAFGSAANYVRHDLLPLVGGWLMRLPWLVLVPIFAFFLLKDAELFRQYALRMVQRKRLRWRFDVFFEDVSRTLAAYIRAQVTACLVVAAICSVGFVALGVPYPVLFGVCAGLLEALPLAGPLVLATMVVVFVGLESLSRAAGVAVFLFAVRVTQDYVIYPRLVGRELPLHPLAVILAILCGGEIAGVAGIFLSVPVLAILTVAYRHWRAHQAAEGPRPALA